MGIIPFRFSSLGSVPLSRGQRNIRKGSFSFSMNEDLTLPAHVMVFFYSNNILITVYSYTVREGGREGKGATQE